MSNGSRDDPAHLEATGEDSLSLAKQALIPWIYRMLESGRVGPGDMPRRLRELEVRLIYALRNSEDSAGLIGRRARENLRRFPSNIYWQALSDWGIFRFPGGQDQYYASLGTYYDGLRRSRERSDDGEPLHDRTIDAWHPDLPDAEEDFLEETSFRMTSEEAEFLTERIQASKPATLLAFLAGLEYTSDVRFPWQHPAYDSFPAHIKRQLHHAQALSEVTYGATLLYNLMLAEASGAAKIDREEPTDEPDGSSYEVELEKWASLVEESEALSEWNREEFWELLSSGGARVPTQTRAFVDTWCDIALAPGGAISVSRNDRARSLIKNRELAKKRAQARLSYPRALELWSGASGVFRYGYRWGSAKVLLTDIMDGLSRRENNA